MYDAARFTNWLTNGQGSGGTETGVYNLASLLTGGSLPADHSYLVGTGTKWFLPTEDEWYKAAYYKGGGTNAGYWKYPFQSDTQPTFNQTPGDSNSANVYNGVLAVTQLGSWSYVNNQNYLTDVGAYTSALSPYGSFDMGGDVFQWNETSMFISGRGFGSGERGGSWDIFSTALGSTYRNNDDPTLEASSVGFRVAELPEPGTLTLFVIGAAGFLAWAWRRSRSRCLVSRCP